MTSSERVADSETGACPDCTSVDTDNRIGVDSQGQSEDEACGPAEAVAEQAGAADLLVGLEGLSSRIDDLMELFRQRLRYDQSKEDLIRRLSQELENQREESLRRTLKPLVLDLLMLYDSLGELIRSWESRCETTRHGLLEGLRVFEQELLEVLARQDVHTYADSPKWLDLRLHRTVETQQTCNPDDDGRIASVAKSGFLWGEAVLRREEVTVTRYRAPAEPHQSAAEEEMKGVG